MANSDQVSPSDGGAVEVDAAMFLAAQLRSALVEASNLRTELAEVRQELAAEKAKNTLAQVEKLDKIYGVGKGSVFQARSDGTFWRLKAADQVD